MLALRRAPRREKGAQWTIEPLVPLRAGLPLCGEVLARPIPRSRRAWRRFYTMLAERFGDLFDTTPGGYAMLSVNADSWQVCDPVIGPALERMARFPMMVEWTERDPDLAEVAGAMLQIWRDLYGIRIALDDIGAGMDSWRRAIFSAPNWVKVDGLLLHHARHSAHRSRYAAQVRAELQGEVRRHQRAGRIVTLEWIETARDLETARMVGADYGQGRFWHG